MNLDSLLEKFRLLLENSKLFDLEELTAEVSDEDRDKALVAMIRQEVEFYRNKNWTYSKLSHRIQSFPHLRDEILRAIDESVSITPGISSLPEHLFANCQYKIENNVFAEGGQGVIYRSEDLGLGNRQVAIKIVKDVSDATKFLQEAEITAKLEHPGVVPVYAFSEKGMHKNSEGEVVEGRPFYAMRMVEGQSLLAAISELHNDSNVSKKSLFFDSKFINLIECLISVCHTVAYAHSVGVLHCDIKPENIMIGDFGATIVLDWGSSVSVEVKHHDKTPKGRKRIACPEWSTESLGTEAYASPEQWGNWMDTETSQIKTLTAAADVYSLGATLYQVITGRTPIDLRDYQDRKKRDELGSVQFANSNCPNNLEAICVKAMKTAPQDRYQGPEELAEDLFSWLRGDPVSTVRDTILDKTFRMLNRHRAASMLGVLLGLSIFGMIGLAGYNMYNSQLKNLKNVQLKASVNSGFTLIEEICEPLENGEVQDRDELRAVAVKVLEHSQRELANKFSIPKGEQPENIEDKLEMARLLKLQSLTKYFDANNTGDSLADEVEDDVSDSDKKRTTRKLYEAIVSIDHAIELFESAMELDENFVSRYLATSHLFAARLHHDYDRNAIIGNPEAMLSSQAHGNDNHLKSAEWHIELAIDCFSKRKNVPGILGVLQQFQTAETYQLKGEVLRTKLSHITDASEARKQRQDERLAFETCIELINEIELSEKQDELKQKKWRALGRGHGYLGDIKRDQGDYDGALASYRDSLEFRKKIKTNDFETARQLARGESNFLRMLLGAGVLLDESGETVYLEQEADSKMIHDYILLKINEFVQGDSETKSAIELFKKLAGESDANSIVEYGNLLNLISELYLYVAKQDPTDESAIEESRNYADLAIDEFKKLESSKAVSNRRSHTGTSYSDVLKICLNQLVDESKKPHKDIDVILEELPGIDDEQATDEEVLLRCILLQLKLKEKPGYKKVLKKGMRRLAASGRNIKRWRILQFFDDELVGEFDRENNGAANESSG